MVSNYKQKIAETFGEMTDRAIEQNRWESADRHRAVENRPQDGLGVERISLEIVHWQMQMLSSAQSTVVWHRVETTVPKGGVKKITNLRLTLQ